MPSVGKIALIALVTMYYSVVALVLIPFDKTRHHFHQHARHWARLLLRIAGVQLHVEGLQHISRDAGAVYVSNHASLFDIPVLIAGLSDNVRIMYKRELRKIPFLGWILALSPYIPVDRANPKDAMESIEQAAENIRNGSSVIIFAEGTRSADGQLGPFKRGAFLLATRSRKPIVPVAIIGSHTILPAGTSRIQAGKVHLIVEAPIHSEAMDRAAEKELMNTVRLVIAAQLEHAETT